MSYTTDSGEAVNKGDWRPEGDERVRHRQPTWGRSSQATIIGYACACPQPDAPTTPAVVLDPMGGTGTTALVAHTLGRHGVTVDLSADYCRLAEWRIGQSGHGAKALDRTWAGRQQTIL